MNEKKNKTGSTKKVVPFDIDEKLLDDEKIDRLIKESLIEEADEIEAELENDPALIGVGASEDMFQSIVARLKEQGDWEEEKDREENPENTKEIKNAEDTKEILEDQKSEQEKLEELYRMLPEEDRHALELGKQVKKEKEIRRRKRKQRWKILKRGGVVAAVFLLVFGVSMTSEANRRLVLKAWDGLMFNLGFKLETNNLEEEKTMRSINKNEMEAMETIYTEIDVPPLMFGSIPKGMEYFNYEIVDSMEAIVFYTYNEKIMNVTMINLKKEGVSYYALDNEAVLCETITNDQDIVAKIWETNLDEEETYIVEIEHEGCRYLLNAMISKEELKKMIKSAYIL